jgi:hypothetical protein
MYNSSRGYQLISNQSYLVPGALLSMCNCYPDIAKNIHVWSQDIAMYGTVQLPGAQGIAKYLCPVHRIELSLHRCLMPRILSKTYAHCPVHRIELSLHNVHSCLVPRILPNRQILMPGAKDKAK